MFFTALIFKSAQPDKKRPDYRTIHSRTATMLSCKQSIVKIYKSKIAYICLFPCPSSHFINKNCVYEFWFYRMKFNRFEQLQFII